MLNQATIARSGVQVGSDRAASARYPSFSHRHGATDMTASPFLHPNVLPSNSAAMLENNHGGSTMNIVNAIHLRLAVLIPCYNEELTIQKVVRDFRIAL